MEDDLEGARQSFIQALKTNQSFVREYRVNTKTGDILWIQDRGQIVRDDKGEIAYVSGVFFDITDRKLTEQALRESEKELRLLSSQLLTVQEDERARIARELHDSIGQTLSAIKYKIEGSFGRVDQGTNQAEAEACEALISTVQNAVEEVRRIYTDLRPSLLDDLGIVATIGWFCREFQEVYPEIVLETKIHLEEKDIPESLKIMIYRVLQEALNNIAKHSRADRAHITLRKKVGDIIELVVEDNGKGFDLQEALTVEAAERGIGLGSMKERTELSGGSFSLESSEGNGTSVRAVWPSQGA